MIAPNIFVQQYLHVVDQVGVQGTVGLWGNNYLEANVGYLKSAAHADRPGGTASVRLPAEQPHSPSRWKAASTRPSSRPATAVAQWLACNSAICCGRRISPPTIIPMPMQVPRVRYEVIAKTTHRGVSPPVANAGPDQIGIPAGTVTLNGSGSYDPNGEALTYQWVQEGGPAVALSAMPIKPIATFTGDFRPGLHLPLDGSQYGRPAGLRPDPCNHYGGAEGQHPVLHRQSDVDQCGPVVHLVL